MQPDLTQRLEQVESQLAFQEDTIEQLNQLVTQQNQELHQLQQHVKLLAEKYQELTPDEPEPQDERPPHY